MSDEQDKPEDRSADAEEQMPLGGERLAEARRDQQISVVEIAKELHLDEAKVRALEINEFESLGAPVFAKGHLRKYAQLVGVDQDDVLTDYYRLTRSQVIPPVVSKRAKPRRELSPGPWIAVFAIVVAIGVAYWFITWAPLQPAVDASQAVPETPAPSTEAPAAVDETPAGDTAPEEEAITEPVEVQQAEPEPAQQVAPPPAQQTSVPADGDVMLSITFLGDCWTEISDASGRRLFFSLGREGQTVDLSGQSPLSVLFGDADNVTLTVNGSDFAIADADRRGRTARLVLYGP